MSTKGGRFAGLVSEAEEPEGREMTTGKHAQVAVQFEWEAEGNGMLYGFLLGSPYLGKEGIQFVFEGAYCKGWGHWIWDDWEISLVPAPGASADDIRSLWCHLTDHTQRRVKVGSVIKTVEVKRACIVGRTPPPKPGKEEG